MAAMNGCATLNVCAESVNVVLKDLERHGQFWLVEHLRGGPEDVRLRVCEQLSQIDLDAFFNVVHTTKGEKNSFPMHEMHPSQVISVNEVCSRESLACGETAIRKGELAFFVVAGGQGSRLGFEHPKGMFPAAPLTGRSLFQIHMEKTVAFGRRFGFDPRFLVMTSPGNHKETEAYFAENEFFGLRSENVFLFSQGELPAVDANNRLILSASDQLFLAPDGHGGSLTALKRSGVLNKVAQCGIKYLSYFQVDNPMVNLCDAGFLGTHILNGAEVSTKVIAKRDALEKLGHPVQWNGRTHIIEYSDLPEAEARKQSSSGKLFHSHGSIGIHLFSLDFVERITSGALSLPFHVAHKGIPFFDNVRNEVVIPNNSNGRKFEQFVFDSLPLATKTVFAETQRGHEFAPLKNKFGDDSIATCKQMQSNYFKEWFVSAGYNVSELKLAEVSPAFACCVEEFCERVKGIVVRPCGQIFLG